MNKKKKPLVAVEVTLLLTVYINGLIGFFHPELTAFALVNSIPFLVFALYNILVSKTL